ncbi:retrovirus-related pol polyprotein from transposon TNT 1-94, partial [Trifolium medium]|nr:retrovirus-related pol polyprotein from transposon TNT 1-94 [Trifolium medium]
SDTATFLDQNDSLTNTHNDITHFNPPTENRTTNTSQPIDTDDDSISQITNTNIPDPASHTSNTHTNDQNPTPAIPTHSRPLRAKHVPSYMSDYVCSTSNSSSTAASKGTLYPISSYHSLAHLSDSHRVFIMSVTHNTEPTTYSEACKSEAWVKAMNSELDALAKTGTWKFVDLPPNVKPIGSKWVYKIKHKSDGTIERYKARLVAKGYNQIEGLDFFDTFSPVAKLSTVRMLLAIASIKGWHLHQLDVNNAFLHGELQEDVYMSVPEGIQSPKPNQVCKLLKSLYGLKQASRKWYERLTSLLLQEGYSQSSSDYSLFTSTNNSHFTALLVYVDDIILAGTDLSEFQRIKAVFRQ